LVFDIAHKPRFRERLLYARAIALARNYPWGRGVQHLINRAAFERAAAEAFTGVRSHYCVMALLALGVAAAAGFAVAAIWFGFALLVEEIRRALVGRLGAFSHGQGNAARLALAITANASLAAAPAVAWYAAGPLGPVLAAAMLCLLLSHAAFSAQDGRLHAALSCAPYAALSAVFVLHAAGADVLGAMLVCLACVAYVAAKAMHHANCASHARLQDREWVRQLSMSCGNGAVAWEIDYVRGELFGAERLAALVGRPVAYGDVIERACFASAADRALVKAALSPARGAPRHIALEHEAVRADGSRVRVRHTGFVCTTPDDQPVRLACVTRVIGAAANAAVAPRSVETRAPSKALKTLRSELSSPVGGALKTSIAALSGDLAAALRALALRGEALECGIDYPAAAAAECANPARDNSSPM
jgi:hypothetical protein